MQRAALALALLGASVGAIKIDFTDDASIKNGASTIAYGLMKYYSGNETGQTPGVLPKPYYWWETGAMFNTLIDYWAQTGDDAYNAVTKQGLLWQVGEANDFMPVNQTTSEGSDDQGVWALAALSAAESGFPSPSDGEPQWLDLAQNVFDDLVARWDTKTCGGGLRWQIFTFNAGYDYKNSASNGVFFDLAARLYLQTKNSTYSHWASEVFEWEQKVGLISDSYDVFDGIRTESCGTVSKIQNSMNAGLFLHGSAAMYNATTSSEWKTRVDGLLKGVQGTFVKDGGVLFEAACEGQGTCNVDMQGYKSFLVRGLRATAELAAYTGGTVRPLLVSSAKAAAAACSGTTTKMYLGKPGTVCGFSWVLENGQVFDGKIGVGEQMNALSAVISTLSSGGAAQGGGEGSSSGGNGTSTVGPSKTSGTSGAVTASVTPPSAGTRIAADAVAVVAALGGVVVGLW
ncbi:glycoside hydrolase family 76 protein [Trichoderma longibrachiatum]|uniref:Mannan endo-1,6-alpha-mannosidase n=1 Tax=Trichoderma longibrachiatum ATCC 18648 TaxID=983965 RepID=A0A2T4BZG9_TRILO|nr:family 76 glycoside hydrolase [Trichoderma longibrachiatum ATCC 18648]